MKYDRLNKIKQLLIDQKQVSCTDLCNMFDVSIETVRRDLAVLEKEGVIKRVYGGAALSDNTAAPNPMKPWGIRSNLNNAEKMNIDEFEKNSPVKNTFEKIYLSADKYAENIKG